MAEKKKAKNLIKFRDSHRNFVRKTIAEAKDLISGGNPAEASSYLSSSEVFGASSFAS